MKFFLVLSKQIPPSDHFCSTMIIFMQTGAGGSPCQFALVLSCCSQKTCRNNYRFQCYKAIHSYFFSDEIKKGISLDNNGTYLSIYIIFTVIRYEVTSITGNLWNASTDANVYITIYGDRGDTGVRQLFSKDKIDLFKQGKVNILCFILPIIPLYGCPKNCYFDIVKKVYEN